MLKSFTIEHKTDGETKCSIYVEPDKKWLSGTVTVDGVIKRGFTEKEPGVFNDIENHWRDLDYFERKASAVAKSFSPFWRGEAPAKLRFEAGKTYTCRSVCDHDTVFSWDCIKRTAKTLTLKKSNTAFSKNESFRVKIYTDSEGNEYALPSGRYSMCPVIRPKL